MDKLKSIFRGKTWGGSLIRVLLLLTICTVPFWYHYKPVWIDGISMIPTYEDGQWTLMQRTRSFNDAWRPDRFDVIAVSGTGGKFSYEWRKQAFCFDGR